jgi:hypothetical protein
MANELIAHSDISQSPNLGNQFKPAILQSFGDIAQCIGGAFEPYLSVVAQVLQQAANVNNVDNSTSFEMIDYIVSLREGIMDAWGGIIIAVRTSQKRKEIFRPPLFYRIANTLYRTTYSAIRRLDFPAAAERLRRPEPHRGASQIKHGCHWVSEQSCELRDLANSTSVTFPRHSRMAKSVPTSEMTGSRLWPVTHGATKSSLHER